MTTAVLPLRLALIDTCRALWTTGLTFGTSGNVSARIADGTFLISASGMDYDALSPDDLVVMNLDGTWTGRRTPSSEWRFHRDILRARPEVGAIVHTHSTYATALACRGEGIPSFHYMVALAGGAEIRCAPYFTFGTQQLSDAALTALEDRRACLLANHGVIAVGASLPAALRLAGEVENLARQYLTSLLGGRPQLLESSEMQRVAEKFTTYGQRGHDGDGTAAPGNSTPGNGAK